MSCLFAACRPDGEAATDDLGSNNRSLQEGLFATLYTLTKNKALDTSLRVAALRVVLEFLQVGWLVGGVAVRQLEVPARCVLSLLHKPHGL